MAHMPMQFLELMKGYSKSNSARNIKNLEFIRITLAITLSEDTNEDSNINITKTIVINKPVNDVWKIIAHDFDLAHV